MLRRAFFVSTNLLLPPSSLRVLSVPYFLHSLLWQLFYVKFRFLSCIKKAAAVALLLS